MGMRLGLVRVSMRQLSRPAALAAAARAAGAAGFDALWAGEHVVLPDPQVPAPAVRLVTGIVIVAQRGPVVLAKEVASLDVLRGGGVTLGVGAGYLEPGFRSVGANYAGRGAVTGGCIDAMRSLWRDPRPADRGRFVDFAGVDAYPRPVRRRLPLRKAS